jgi:DNA-binding MurR/RpiR family transcriptional regulator
MTPAERRVARTLLATYPSAGLESLPHLAEGAGVTGPTVLRFVRKIGFDGYPDFQRSLRSEVQARAEGLPSLYRMRAASQADDLLLRTRRAFARALDSTFGASSLKDEVESVVTLLADRKRTIWFVGGRFSQLVARYLYLQLRMLRPACAIVGEAPDDRLVDGLEIARRDVLCLFDYRRYQDDTVAVGRVAAERGATVVVFTDAWLSPAVEYARHVLIAHGDSASPFDSFVGPFALTELIAAKVVVELGELGRARVGNLEGERDRIRNANIVASADPNGTP